jgi:site-specific DNA-methyltransferase (cytosine-N4-specific)
VDNGLYEVRVQRNLFPYEHAFLLEELNVLGATIVERDATSLTVQAESAEHLNLLTYADAVRSAEGSTHIPVQALFEGTRPTRQSTRYGPHGIHDYRGKFNPQMPRSLMVQLGIGPGHRVLDPFCGSGTTLVEAAFIGANALGVELNPIAAMVAEAKKAWLSREEVAVPVLGDIMNSQPFEFDPQEGKYLTAWFPAELYEEVRLMRGYLNTLNGVPKALWSALFSNLLRNHSLQEPKDLRVRRRKSVPPGASIVSSFLSLAAATCNDRNIWLQKAQMKAIGDIRVKVESSADVELGNETISAVITSPPYAMALPYVDTYRLSGVALGLITARDLGKTERLLIGARDITKSEKDEMVALQQCLPEDCTKIVSDLRIALENDKAAGFRKQAVPDNLVRYLVLMRDVLMNLRTISGQVVAHRWVIGPNHTNLAGRRIEIPTPQLIAALAEDAGYRKIFVQKVDAYPRYDLHSKNSIRTESIVGFVSDD